MYNLGEHFKNKDFNNLITEEKMVFRGSKYRISVLTERLMRLEYSPDGMFNNYETVNVKNRRFEMPEFSKQEDENILRIETPVFVLTYLKESNFSGRTLNAKINDKEVWYYGQKEVRNLGGTIVSLDSKLELMKGLFAIDGVATIDDSKSLCFDENSNVINNPTSKNYIDIYLFIYGKDFGMCLMDYYKLTSMPPLFHVMPLVIGGVGNMIIKIVMFLN